MRKILIVEDHFPTAAALKFILNRQGYEVMHDACGEAAVDRLAKGDVPDLMILDLGLGAMDGHEVLRHTRAVDQTRLLPVIVFSAIIDDETGERLISAGANEYWIKSKVDTDYIITRVHAYLNSAEPAKN